MRVVTSETQKAEILLNQKDIAELIGVSASAVANWRKRPKSKFPKPALENSNGALFRKEEIIEWMKEHNYSSRKSTVENLDDIENLMWLAADKLRGSIDASQYRHVILTLIFLSHFVRKHDSEESLNQKWSNISSGKNIHKKLNMLIESIEELNESLRGVIPRVFDSRIIDENRTLQLFEVIKDLSSSLIQNRDDFGRIYEYFLGKFAALEGRSGGEFYTPESIVQLLCRIIVSPGDSIYDPCCGSGGMFIQSKKYLEKINKSKKITVYGQELNPSTWRMARMNLFMHEIQSDLSHKPADTFHEDLHKDRKFDAILANPPFNISEWFSETISNDPRWRYGMPSNSNANMAWILHIVHHLEPGGRAGIVLSNGSSSSDASSDLTIRQNLLKANLIESIIAMPTQLFYSTPIPVTLWILRGPSAKSARKEVLFIDARNTGVKVTRTHRDIPQSSIDLIVDTVKKFRNTGEVLDSSIANFASLKEIETTGWSLVPSRYVKNYEVIEQGETNLVELQGEYKQLVDELRKLDDKLISFFNGQNKG